MLKKLATVIVLFCMIISLSSCSGQKTVKSNTVSNGKLKVLVTFNAMKEFAQAVGGDKVDIETMIPDGTEPHDFEPKVKDLQSLSDSGIFIYNGLNMERWVDRALKVADNKNLVVVDASTGSKPIEEGDSYDPHLWLSLKGAETEAKNIKNAFEKADPANKIYYENNYKTFKSKLDALFNEYNKKFKTVGNKNFVTGHAAFAYLCRDFGLKQSSVENVFAEGEPSAKQLKELVDYCRENHIETIFVEDMVSPKVSETLASEVGAEAKGIYTLESSVKGKDYIECMKDNLELIYTSLK